MESAYIAHPETNFESIKNIENWLMRAIFKI